MHFKKCIIIVISVQFAFISCAREEYIRLSPVEGSGIWIDGREYSEQVSDKVKICISFDKNENSNFIFDLNVINNSHDSLLFDPAELYYIPVQNSINTKRKAVMPETVKALDPEIMLYKLNTDINNENSAYDTNKLINAVGGCASVGSGFSARNSEQREKAYEMMEDSNREMDEMEIQHINKINNYKEQIKYIESKAFRKSTVFPGKSKDGKIFFPAEKGISSLLLRVPARKDFVEFTFKKDEIKRVTEVR